MTGKQLRHAEDIVFRAYQKLEKLARTQPELAAQVTEVQTLWMGMHKQANAQLVLEGERKDKGVVLWTVFQPTMLGKGETAYCGGVREIVRTPWRHMTIHHWNNSPPSDTHVRPTKPVEANWDFKSAMRQEAA